MFRIAPTARFRVPGIYTALKRSPYGLSVLIVLEYLEFTQLSNLAHMQRVRTGVLEYLEFTQLSNHGATAKI